LPRRFGAVFGEGERRKSSVSMLLGTGRKLRPVQDFGLGTGEGKYEIVREAFGIAQYPGDGRSAVAEISAERS
jgi:hypothetical protein